MIHVVDHIVDINHDLATGALERHSNVGWLARDIFRINRPGDAVSLSFIVYSVYFAITDNFPRDEEKRNRKRRLMWGEGTETRRVSLRLDAFYLFYCTRTCSLARAS
jgi:hypothetical protein